MINTPILNVILDKFTIKCYILFPPSVWVEISKRKFIIIKNKFVIINFLFIIIFCVIYNLNSAA